MPMSNLGKRYKHEDYTTAIIEDSRLGKLIDQRFKPVGISAHLVASLFDRPFEIGEEGLLLRQFVSGELDADRMDYLLRDSLYAGVIYGVYDLQRLLDTITVGVFGTRWFLGVGGVDFRGIPWYRGDAFMEFGDPR